MKIDRLHPGDLIQCKVRGVSFEARYEGRGDDGLVSVDPVDRWATWHWVKPRQIVKRLERKKRLEAAV